MSDQTVGIAQLLDVTHHAVATNNAFGEPVPFGLALGAAFGLEHAMVQADAESIALDDAIISTYNYINWYVRN